MDIIKTALLMLFLSGVFSFNEASARHSKQRKNKSREIRKSTHSSRDNGPLSRSGPLLSDHGASLDQEADVVLGRPVSLRSNKKVRSRPKKYRRKGHNHQHKSKSQNKRKNRRPSTSALENSQTNQNETQDFETDVSEVILKGRGDATDLKQTDISALPENVDRPNTRRRKSKMHRPRQPKRS